MMNFLCIIDWAAFSLFAVYTLYLFVFALFSRVKTKRGYTLRPGRNRFCVLFPAYKEDLVIEDSVRSFFEQSYPRDLYRVVVISDSMTEDTNQSLRDLGADVLVVDYEKRSKAAALNFAMSRLKPADFDAVVIMDADNHVLPDFLHRLNNTFQAGVRAMQAHRVAKNENTEIAYLDGMSEEINNSIFRKGHVHAGLSSALSGSGMAFDFAWFKENVEKLDTVGEDKELELLLLYDNIHIDYLEDVYVWDEKVQTSQIFSGQRQRWLSAQYTVLLKGFKLLPTAYKKWNIDFLNKLFQWMIPPRLILIGGGLIMTLFVSAIHISAGWKWIGAFLLLMLGLVIATPVKLLNRKLFQILRFVPRLFISLVMGIINIRKDRDKFIHTPHGQDK